MGSVKNIALIGYGVVGRGVAELLEKNAGVIEKRAGGQVRLKYILTARPRAGDVRQELITQNADDIFNDGEISIIAECVNDLEAAYAFCKRALVGGRHYVTSNKNLIATYGPELTELAYRSNVSLMFEASVAGGVPIMRPLYKCLSANRVNGIAGIVNGTTNYILTQMKREGQSFGDALKSAQELGYAETDPSADVQGFDACRKLAILVSVAFGSYVSYEDIATEGITEVTSSDITLAEQLGYSIKLIAMGRLAQSGRIYARVSPLLIPHENMLSMVEGVFNAVNLSTDTAGDLLFYGRGAGAEPTASAIVGDVIDIAAGGRYNDPVWRKGNGSLLPVEENICSLFVRAAISEREKLSKAFSGGVLAEVGGELGFITPDGIESETREKIRASQIKARSIWRVKE